MPVAEAGVEFAWTDLSKSGRSQKKAQSDSNGLFSLTGVRGKHLSVKVTKQNYYSAKSNLDSFFYAGENVNFVPDRTNLIVFRLKKRGSGERLLRTSGRIKVPLTAEPIELDLITAKPVRLGEGDIRLECSSDYLHKNEDRQFDWGLKVFVPGGDLVESKDELDFEAPEKGYAPTYELKMPSSLENSWANSVEKTFFFKLKNGNFARVSFLFISYNGVFRFESFVNPSGSRNLEYDPAVQAVQAVFE
jgi:hypothetical protein